MCADLYVGCIMNPLSAYVVVCAANRALRLTEVRSITACYYFAVYQARLSWYPVCKVEVNNSSATG